MVEAKLRENLSRYQDKVMPEEIVEENKILSIFGAIKDHNVEEVQKAEAMLRELVDEGKMINALRGFNRQEHFDRLRQTAIETLTGGQGLPEGIETTGVEKVTRETRKQRIADFVASTGQSQVGWSDILDMLSSLDKSSRPFRSFLNQKFQTLNEENAEALGLEENQAMMRAMTSEAYDVPSDRARVKKLAELALDVEVGIFTNNKGKQIKLIFTRDELIKRWIELQDPTLKETFVEGMGYTPEMITAINKSMTAQDKVFGQLQLDFYQEYYNSVNQVYREQYGLDLPQNPKYSPLRREGFTENEGGQGEFLQDVLSRASVAPGSLKSRVKNIRTISKQGSTQVLQTHIARMEHYKAWANKIRELGAVFNDPEVRTAIKAFHGKDFLGTVDGFLADMTRGGESRAFNVALFDKMRSKFARAVLAVKVAIGVKQLTSFVAFADSIPTLDFTKLSTEFWKNPIENGKFLRKNSVLLRTRGQKIERDLAVAEKSDRFNAFRKNPSFFNLLTLNIKAGDQGAIIAGGWPVYKFFHDQAISSGKTEEQAVEAGIKEFEQITKTTQQSAAVSDQSELQRGGTFAKWLTLFGSAPNQFFRKELGAIRNQLLERQTAGQTAKTLIIYHFLIPMMFQFASDLFRFDKKNQLRAAIIGSFNGIFIARDALDFLVRYALNQRTFSSEPFIFDAVDDLTDAFRLFKIDDITTDDVVKALRGLAGAQQPILGLPAKQVVDFSVGSTDFIKGDYLQGMSQILGWSPYIVGERFDEPEGGGVGVGIPSVKIPSLDIPSIKIPTLKIPSLSI